MPSAAQGPPAEPRGAASEALEVLHALATASPIGLALFDGATFSVRWTNEAYLALLDEPYRTAGVVGLRLETFAPGARVVPGLLAAVSATGRPERLDELEYRGLARGVTTWQVTLRPVERGAGQARDVLLSLVEVTDQVAQRRRAELVARQAREAELGAQRGVDRLARLLEITAALAAAPSQAEVAGALIDGVRRSVGAAAGVLLVPSGQGSLEVAASHGLDPGELEGLRRAPLSAPLPSTVAASRGVPIWLEDLAGVEREFPGLSRLPSLMARTRALVALPLRVGSGELRGVLGLGFQDPRPFEPGERAFLLALGEQGAQALERARLYESERAARAEAERASALQERLMAIVGHDLRTPLAAITLTTQSLQRRGLGEREGAALAHLASSAARMAGIIRDLLDFARVRQGQSIPVRLARLRADELCRRVVGELKVAHPGAAIEEAYQGPLEILGDADRLHQVVANLLDNAVQHGPGRPVLVAARQEGDEVAISVQNGGPPIDPAFLPRIFEPFRRGEGRGEGIGLGLHIVNEIVKAHGGRVEASSSSEAGTRFTVRLAAAPPG